MALEKLGHLVQHVLDGALLLLVRVQDVEEGLVRSVAVVVLETLLDASDIRDSFVKRRRRLLPPLSPLLTILWLLRLLATVVLVLVLVPPRPMQRRERRLLRRVVVDMLRSLRRQRAAVDLEALGVQAGAAGGGRRGA